MDRLKRLRYPAYIGAVRDRIGQLAEQEKVLGMTGVLKLEGVPAGRNGIGEEECKVFGDDIDNSFLAGLAAAKEKGCDYGQYKCSCSYLFDGEPPCYWR